MKVLNGQDWLGSPFSPPGWRVYGLGFIFGIGCRYASICVRPNRRSRSFRRGCILQPHGRCVAGNRVDIHINQCFH